MFHKARSTERSAITDIYTSVLPIICHMSFSAQRRPSVVRGNLFLLPDSDILVKYSVFIISISENSQFDAAI